jgi:hypothetical protein
VFLLLGCLSSPAHCAHHSAARSAIAYTAPFAPNSTQFEKFTSPLPQILSDRFGWPQMVAGFAARYNALPPDVRARTGIFCGNYGEASAVNILGPQYGLPTAISGHQNYFFWGWNGYTGESMLTLGTTPADYADTYAEVIDLGPSTRPGSWTTSICTTSGCATAKCPTPRMA